MKKILSIFTSVALIATASLLAHDKNGHGKNGMANDHFKKMDTNADNKVSKEEWQKFHDGFFTELDKDADGSSHRNFIRVFPIRSPHIQKRFLIFETDSPL